jgi:hypothetical protein
VRFQDPTRRVVIDDRRLVEPQGGWDSLVTAINHGAFDAYLNAGSPWTMTERWHETAPTLLFLAAAWAPPGVVEALLRRGASPSIYSGLPRPKERVDQYSLPPVCGAAGAGNVEALRLLLDAGGSVDDGVPVADAVRNGHRACFDLLLERGANVAATDSGSAGTILSLAEDRGRSDMAEELRRRLAARRQDLPPRLLREVKRGSKVLRGGLSAFARARWEAHLSWVLFAIKQQVELVSRAIGGQVVEEANTRHVNAMEVTFLLQMTSSKWTWYLWRPELHQPQALPKDIAEQRTMAIKLSAKCGSADVLIFRDANVDKISDAEVAAIYADRWPPFSYAEHGGMPKVSSKQALADLDALCEKEGLELPHLIIGNDGLEWTIEVVNYPIANIRRVDAIVESEE